MTITTLPTQTASSLGSEKSNVKSLTDETHQLSAEQWNETVETVIALANEVGLSDGTTEGSLNARVTALEEGGGADVETLLKKHILRKSLSGILSNHTSGGSTNLRKWGRIIVTNFGMRIIGYDEYEFSVSPTTAAGLFGYIGSSFNDSWSLTTSISSGFSNAKFNSFCEIKSSNKLICVGYGGLIRTATNSTVVTSWTTVTPPSSYTGEYNDIIYIEDLSLVVAIGSGGAIHTSSDGGATFTAQTNPDTSLDPVSIAYGNGVICIRTKGPSGFALTSTDGLTWTKQTTVGADPDYCSQMFFDGENFVCFAATVSISPDGENWSIKGTISGTMQPRCIAGKNGIYVAAGYDSGPALIFSVDQGATWESIDLQNANYYMLDACASDFSITCIVMDDFGRFLMMGSSKTNSDYLGQITLYSEATGNIFD